MLGYFAIRFSLKFVKLFLWGNLLGRDPRQKELMGGVVTRVQTFRTRTREKASFFYNLARTLISGSSYIHSLLMVIYGSFDVVFNYGLSRYFKNFEWLLSAPTRTALQNLFLCFWTKSVFKRNLNPKLVARSCSAIREEKIVLFLMTISSGRLLE